MSRRPRRNHTAALKGELRRFRKNRVEPPLKFSTTDLTFSINLEYRKWLTEIRGSPGGRRMAYTSWKFAIEVGGLFFAAVGIFWRIYVFFSKQGRIKVSANYGRTHPDDVRNGAPDEEFLVITAVNTGERPITIVSAGVDLTTGGQVIIESHVPGFPIKLLASHPEDFKINFKSIPMFPVSAWVRDSLYKVHRSQRRFVGRPPGAPLPKK